MKLCSIAYRPREICRFDDTVIVEYSMAGCIFRGSCKVRLAEAQRNGR